jgi:hypothetical protein
MMRRFSRASSFVGQDAEQYFLPLESQAMNSFPQEWHECDFHLVLASVLRILPMVALPVNEAAHG